MPIGSKTFRRTGIVAAESDIHRKKNTRGNSKRSGRVMSSKGKRSGSKGSSRSGRKGKGSSLF